ncbi:MULTISPECIES: hypothetical protein [Thalassolituus]|jgi:hypothetical protein|uniref:hypothetical protein n=1 Tax=Thalassolituus TaxID=187492 RepID=UPI0009493FC8|nr:hypothetical protein [Thalassolituus oleivorans]APR67156.1 hypothetical protein CN03_09555 [Thalassolituus oleivorans]
MKKIGPQLQTLTSRLANTPVDFLDEPRIGSVGRLVVAALVNDAFKKYGHQLSIDELRLFEGVDQATDRNRLKLVSLAVWLLNDAWFAQVDLQSSELLTFLNASITQLAESTKANKCVEDSDRREEFVRYFLARLDYRPEGESEAQAKDRLSALSSTERQRLLDESRDAEKRAREIRQALARKAAEQSADKWTRE